MWIQNTQFKIEKPQSYIKQPAYSVDLLAKKMMRLMMNEHQWAAPTDFGFLNLIFLYVHTDFSPSLLHFVIFISSSFFWTEFS